MFDRKFSLTYTRKNGVTDIRCSWPKNYKTEDVEDFISVVSCFKNTPLYEVVCNAVIEYSIKVNDVNTASLIIDSVTGDDVVEPETNLTKLIWGRNAAPAITPLEFENFHGGRNRGN